SIIDRLRAEEDGNDHHDQQDAEEKTTNHAAAACGFKVEHVTAHDDSHRDTSHHGDADVVEGRDPPIRQGSRNIVLGDLEGCAESSWWVEVGVYRNNQQQDHAERGDGAENIGDFFNVEEAADNDCRRHKTRTEP